MRSNIRSRSIVNGIVLTVGATILVSVVPTTSGARTARGFHDRARHAFAATAAIGGDPATPAVLKRQNEVLAGLEMSQSTLEKATNDFNTATQHGINQLRGDFANSRGETQQVLQAMNQRIDSMRRWLRSVVVLFLLWLGGLAYAIYRPVRVQDSSFRRRSRAPAMNPADDETAKWQSGETANGPT